MAEHVCKFLVPDNGTPCKHYIRPVVKNEPGFCSQPTIFRCIEALKVKLPAISYSSLTDFIHCKARYKHRKIDGLQMKPRHLPEPLKLGQAWDTLIRQLYEKEKD